MPLTRYSTNMRVDRVTEPTHESLGATVGAAYVGRYRGLMTSTHAQGSKLCSYATRDVHALHLLCKCTIFTDRKLTIHFINDTEFSTVKKTSF